MNTFYVIFGALELYGPIFLFVTQQFISNKKYNKWQGPALGACSGVKKTLHRENKLKKIKLKMATIGPK